jgi:NAD+ synthase
MFAQGSQIGSAITAWLRERLTLAESRGLVVGLSGGIDSAVVARLCQMASPGGVLGAILPCHSDPQDETDARLVAEHFEIPTVRISLDDVHDRLLDTLSASAGEALAGRAEGSRARLGRVNLKPRLRMVSLYYLANGLDYLVAGTGNRSELTIGYYTKYGDGGVDLLPIGNLLKSEVRTLARALDVPAPIIEKTPTAGLWSGQTDEGEMGFTYAQLEDYLRNGPESVSPALALRIERLIRASEHKRALPPMPPAPTSR